MNKCRVVGAGLLVGTALFALQSLVAGSASAADAAAPLPGYQVGPLIKVSPNLSPFRACTADRPGQQLGLLYRNSEIEPWVEVNPARPSNLIAGWQQDRWSNGGARGDYSAYSINGGATWTAVDVRGGSRCSGGPFDRESDPWVSFSPNGTAYFMTLAFDEDLPNGSFGRNAMLVNRSTNGGASWGPPITLIEDGAGQILNDKNSLTADPNNSNFAYAVWDRLRDFTLPTSATAKAATQRRAGMDGVEIARERVRRIKVQGASARQPTVVFFKGPTRFTRTTNGGQSWEPTKVIYDPGPNAQTIGNVVAVQPDGTVIDFFTDIPPNGVLRLALLRSANRGATFESRPTIAHVMSFSLSGTITPDAQELVRDGAILFDVAVDPQFGTLYLVWQDTRFRGVDEVAFSQSTNGGDTWTAPVRINKTPADSNILRQQAFVPSIAVAGDGTLAVTYYDFRFDQDNGREATDHWAIFCQPRAANCARSASWRGEIRLTRQSFDMLDAPIARGHFLGDYVGLTAIGRNIWPVFGIADAPNQTSLFVRKITLPVAMAAN